MEHTVTLTRSDVVCGSAVPSIGAHFHGGRMTYTVRQLLAAAVSDSDNTAVDALLKLVPPQEVTTFLRAHGITGMRVDADFLQKLQHGALLSPTSTHALLALMQAQTKPERLRRGLPQGLRLADKSGTSYTLDVPNLQLQRHRYPDLA
ncbi:serine hydrolase [Frateuria aurantia]|uniref:serine hydrolase n=1 Tax=Frateuria aurantia TaxID=81475 RepID=UPI00059D1AED|nr:serine hydrolase [Frateuria aurantia]